MTKNELIYFLKEWESNEICDAKADYNEENAKRIAQLNSSKIAMAIGLLDSITESKNIII